MEEIKEVPSPKKAGASMLKIVIIIIVLIAVCFGAWYVIKGNGSSSDVDTELDDNVAAVVAIVNDEEISRADFDNLLIAQKAILGEPQDDEQKLALQNQVLDILTSKAVLLQKVKESDLSITDEDLDSQISQIKAQFPDEQKFETALSEQGFTQESFKEFTKNDLLIQNYINSQVDLQSITVSDEEIKAEYDLAVTKQDNLPVLEELSGPIKQQLIQQKQQQLISGFITKLKNESDIEIFLK